MAFPCPLGSDDRVGPRVAYQCRSFDFTLLFEDVFFALLPAAVFLVAAFLRLPHLLRAPVKVTSHHLGTAKLVIILPTDSPSLLELRIVADCPRVLVLFSGLISGFPTPSDHSAYQSCTRG